MNCNNFGKDKRLEIWNGPMLNEKLWKEWSKDETGSWANKTTHGISGKKPVQQQANNTVMHELFHLNVDVKHMTNIFINDSITLYISTLKMCMCVLF